MDSYSSYREPARSPGDRNWEKTERSDSYRARSPGAERSRDRRRSRSPAAVDRYEPRGRRDDHGRDRDDRRGDRRIGSPPANIDRYVPGQDNEGPSLTVNPLMDPCPTYPNRTVAIEPSCFAAWGSMHITRPAAGLLMENCWVWVADHDLEDPSYRQITIFAGRGVLVESDEGRLWFHASSSEHHVLYQYLFHRTRDVYMGQIQTETPYFQPNPPATVPFPPARAYHDPDFAKECAAGAHPDADPRVPCAMAWALKIEASRDIKIYGAGLYSFFNDYSTACCQIGAGARCQQRLFDIGGSHGGCVYGNATASGVVGSSSGVEVYNLNIVGTRAMITRNGRDIASYDDNIAGFTAGIGVYRHDE
ncbi:Glucan 1 like protein [Verticillium longisporum]|nr:Glucan 1 like protein [Verticillium longisporum]